MFLIMSSIVQKYKYQWLITLKMFLLTKAFCCIAFMLEQKVDDILLMTFSRNRSTQYTKLVYVLPNDHIILSRFMAQLRFRPPEITRLFHNMHGCTFVKYFLACAVITFLLFSLIEHCNVSTSTFYV